MTTKTLLNNFDIDDFLTNYWQKKPLLIRAGLANFDFVLEPDDLAGMACEEDIESRLIQGNQSTGYECSNGPLDEAVFGTLPEQDWSILVQAVDHYVPEVATLLDYFRFVPNWRIDDIMVSYATDGGSAGPHFDNYDVFLIQGLGQRRWKLGDKCDSHTPTIEHEHLRLLRDFKTNEEWLLNPGDILYIPPGFSHWGIAEGEHCMTYSVGFRAPSYGEIYSDFCDDQLSFITEHHRFSDPDLQNNQNPGLITDTTIEQIQAILTSFVNDKEKITHWFGRYMSQPKYPHLHHQQGADFDTDSIIECLDDNETLYRNPASRFMYSNSTSPTSLFVDGSEYPCESKLAQCLSNSTEFDEATIRPFINSTDNCELIVILINQGALFFESMFSEDDYD